jgi:hypothetical protein
MEWLKGKKTYIISGLMLTYALAGYLTGLLPVDEAIRIGLEALGFSTIRAGIKKG